MSGDEIEASEHLLLWDVRGAMELVAVQRKRDGMRAHGHTVRADSPLQAAVEYHLTTGPSLETVTLDVTVHSDAVRSLHLARGADGAWTGRRDGDALDCTDLGGVEHIDLEASPLTNTMPVVSGDLLHGGELEVSVAFVRLPSLEVVPVQQRYRHLRTAGDTAVVEYSSGDFRAELTFDADGHVLEYAGLASRIGPAPSS